MDRKRFYSLMQNSGDSDYELYLNTHKLYACQTGFDDLCNGDELQFQIVHQVEELLMKLVAYSVLEIDECIQQRQTNKVLMLFKRVHHSQQVMLTMLDLLGTMPPKDYQEIRVRLGRGSGRDSPGFKTIIKMFTSLWESYEKTYLEAQNLTLEQIYDSQFDYSDAYMVAESMLEFEILFQRFLTQHMQVVNRSIGSEAKSLNGNDIKKLRERMSAKFFPKLWQVRSDMTDRWGQKYGYVRDPIK